MSKYITQTLVRVPAVTLVTVMMFGLVAHENSDTARAVTRTSVTFQVVPQAAITATATPKRVKAMHWALSKRGTWYCYSGAGHGENGCRKGRYDCSGLVMRAYEAAGAKYFGRTTYQMKGSSKTYRTNHPHYGDLVFTSDHHVGLYYSKGKMLDSRKTGTKVSVRAIYGHPTYYHVRGAG